MKRYYFGRGWEKQKSPSLFPYNADKTKYLTLKNIFLLDFLLYFSEGFMETLSRKGQANLRGYFDICDSLAENMIVVVNEEEGDSGSVFAVYLVLVWRCFPLKFLASSEPQPHLIFNKIENKGKG